MSSPTRAIVWDTRLEGAEFRMRRVLSVALGADESRRVARRHQRFVMLARIGAVTSDPASWSVTEAEDELGLARLLRAVFDDAVVESDTDDFAAGCKFEVQPVFVTGLQMSMAAWDRLARAAGKEHWLAASEALAKSASR